MGYTTLVRRADPPMRVGFLTARDGISRSMKSPRYSRADFIRDNLLTISPTNSRFDADRMGRPTTFRGANRMGGPGTRGIDVPGKGPSVSVAVRDESIL